MSLPDALRNLRQASGLSQTAAAERSGVNQTKISRAETGRGLVDKDEVAALCRVYNASPGTRRQLIAMTEALAASRTPRRMVLQRGGWAMQERIGKLENAAKTIRNFAPSAIHGLLQIPAYIEALFGASLSPENLTRTVQARLNRQRVLESDREFHLVMGEGALRWCMGSAAIMVDQLEHLIHQSERPNVHVGIITWTTPTTIPGLHPFTLYDDQAALVATQNATAVITDPRDIADYRGYWDELQPFVSWDDEARDAVHHAAEDYRRIM
ncbi:helix-turn-helix domain-containing protein [Nonomuraea typhae]|uniref:helix-turn-helix domain-containing protein n=1 Tax=Nonomuraea typhae TaxID=2603600 RepID=UPI001C671C8B|nr:helix-turn-helix transcriptional regulator [Nonomuraea typhae]